MVCWPHSSTCQLPQFQGNGLDYYGPQYHSKCFCARFTISFYLSVHHPYCILRMMNSVSFWNIWQVFFVLFFFSSVYVLCWDWIQACMPVCFLILKDKDFFHLEIFTVTPLLISCNFSDWWENHLNPWIPYVRIYIRSWKIVELGGDITNTWHVGPTFQHVNYCGFKGMD